MTIETRNGQTPIDMLTRNGIPLDFGDRQFRVKPRTMKGDKAWLAQVQERIVAKVALLDEPDPINQIIAALGESADDMLALILAYDENGQLPPAEWFEENAYTTQLTTAFTTLLEEAYPPFAVSRRLLPADHAATVIGLLLEWVMKDVMKVMASPLSEPTPLPSEPMASEPPPNSKKPGRAASSKS